ncbi:MAG: hypothetical protein ACKVT2_17525 [Saprospiraceae bacterium]
MKYSMKIFFSVFIISSLYFLTLPKVNAQEDFKPQEALGTWVLADIFYYPMGVNSRYGSMIPPTEEDILQSMVSNEGSDLLMHSLNSVNYRVEIQKGDQGYTLREMYTDITSGNEVMTVFDSASSPAGFLFQIYSQMIPLVTILPSLKENQLSLTSYPRQGLKQTMIFNKK